MADVLNATVREDLGTSRTRRLRKAGMTPANLYGHGGANVALSIPTAEVDAVVRHSSHVVTLQGSVSDEALIKEVQWDAFGNHVLHLDMVRVLAGETANVLVKVELRGDAPGTKVGGVVKHLIHEIEIECPVLSIPDKIELGINTLELGDSLLASALELPKGAKFVHADDEIVVQCVEPMQQESEEGEGGPAEPELITRKKEDEEGGDS